MYHREVPITPSPPAITGALSIYVEVGRKDDVRQMLFGLSVLRHATAEPRAIALPLVEVSQHTTRADIPETLRRQ